MAFVVMGLVLVIRLVREYLATGFLGVNYAGNIFLVVGWGVGYLLAEADHLFYVAMCNPQELSCQRVRREILENRDWRNAWGILQETRGERTRLPIHNIVTGVIVAGLGMWAGSSGVNLLGMGVVSGLALRLVIDFWQEKDKQKWMWVFAREFSKGEINIIGGVWTGLVVVQLAMLMLS